MSKCDVQLKSLQLLMKARGLEPNGRVQQFIDNEVIKYCDPLVPKDEGVLKGSAEAHTVIGSGIVRYVTPYARKRYKDTKMKGQRGEKWFERMKEQHRKDILDKAIEIAGGEKE